MKTDQIMAERQRLEESTKKIAPWKKWGPYLSERQWGTVREDYSDGGVTWVNASSREYKDNIQALGAEAAMEALMNLNPVTFTYKTMPEQGHVGFVAEEVPEIVAMRDRKGLSPMDIVAVLTKVVQEQQGLIKKLEQRLLVLETKGE